MAQEPGPGTYVSGVVGGGGWRELANVPDEQHGRQRRRWGSLKGIARIFGKEWDSPTALDTLRRQNKPKGFMCVSCSWAKPADYHTFEFCENGAKATLWELTTRRCTPEFFAKHTVTELRSWPDYDLEQQGRLTHPMRYDRDSDRYVVCDWDEALDAIGSQLRTLDPKSVIFYSSGRASLETSYLYALFARVYGNNNLPDSSNMCHETTSVALKKVIGAGVGTVVFDDLSNCAADESRRPRRSRPSP